MKSLKLALVSLFAVLALGAIAAYTAWATEAEWMIGTSTLSELSLEEKVSLAGGAMTLAVPFKSLTIECKTTEGSGKILKGGFGELTLALKTCEVPKAAACKVESITIEAKTSSLLVGGLAYEVLEAAKAGKPLSTVTISGEACAFAGKSELTGQVAGEISLEEAVKQPIKFSETVTNTANKELKKAEKAELKLLFGGGKSTAFLSGEPSTALSGEKNTGKEFQDVFVSKLCKEAPPATNECPATKNYGATTTVTAEKEGSVKFIPNGGVAFICDGSKVEGTLTQGEGRPLLASITTVAFTSCSRGAEACTVQAVFPAPPNANYPGQFKAIAQSRGLMKVLNVKLKIWCGMEMACTYGVSWFSYRLTGGTPAKAVQLALDMLDETGGGCPVSIELQGIGTTDLSIEYKFTAPGSPPKMWPTQ